MVAGIEHINNDGVRTGHRLDDRMIKTGQRIERGPRDETGRTPPPPPPPSLLNQ